MTAVLLVLCLEHLVLGTHGPWPSIMAREKVLGSVYWGVARDRVLFQQVRAVDPDLPRIFILGTSRADFGFDPSLAGQLLPTVSFTKVAHANMDPFAIRSTVSEVVHAEVDVAVLMLSEFDTHRPLRLEPLPAKSTADLGALAQLISVTDFSFFRENRESLYRIAASSLSRAYRFRDLLGRGFLNQFREFPLNNRLSKFRPPWMRGKVALGEAAYRRPAPVKEQILLDRLPPRFRKAKTQLPLFSETIAGPHADVQMVLIRDAIRMLREAGVEVFIVECPVHEIADLLQGATARKDFRRFATGLAEDPGVRFVSLQELPAFEEADYSDLFHMNEAGRNRMTTAIVKKVRTVLTPSK